MNIKSRRRKKTINRSTKYNPQGIHSEQNKQNYYQNKQIDKIVFEKLDTIEKINDNDNLIKLNNTNNIDVNSGKQRNTIKIKIEEEIKTVIDFLIQINYYGLGIKKFLKIVFKGVSEGNPYLIKFINSYIRDNAPTLKDTFTVCQIDKEEDRRLEFVNNFVYDFDFEYKLDDEDIEDIYDVLEDEFVEF